MNLDDDTLAWVEIERKHAARIVKQSIARRVQPDIDNFREALQNEDTPERTRFLIAVFNSLVQCLACEGVPLDASKRHG